jgi:C-terminal processing protease CtpA/Prc
MFASAFRDYQLGTIVGLETGGVPTHFGQAPTMKLAHSGIGFQAPTAQYFPVKPREGDDRRGVMPDVAITEKMWAAYRGESDPGLAAALAQVRGK